MIRTVILAMLAASPGATADAPAASVLETSASVPVDQDGCLDHTVRELGMSAKKQGTDRVWNIAPKFLHPSVAQGGTLTVRMEKGDKVSTVLVKATWPGGVKPKDIQPELEARLVAMTGKMGQLCGVNRPDVKCTFTPAGAAPTACNPTP